jgi:hypothetical protein
MTEPKTKWIVELEPGIWIACRAYPFRFTGNRCAAAEYTTQRGAQIALGLARKHRPFQDAKVIPVGVAD